MAKIYLRPEPYDPDAEDADGDGIVQERTAWERPGGTRIVDKFGQAIERGRSLTERPEGIQVVDRAGKPVKYTPTYAGEMAAGSIGAGKGPSSPLSDHGHASLAERGLPTIRSLSMPRPAAAASPAGENVPQEPESPLVPGGAVEDSVPEVVLPDWVTDFDSRKPEPGLQKLLKDFAEREEGWADEEDRLQRLDDLEAEMGSDARSIVEEWFTGANDITYDMRRQIEEGDTDRWTDIMLDMIASSPETSVPTFRGMRLTPDQMQKVIEDGFIDLPLGAFSKSPSSAKEYAADPGGSYRNGIVLRLEPGEKAFPMSAFSPIDEREVLVSGRYEVVGDEEMKAGRFGETVPVLVVRRLKPIADNEPESEVPLESGSSIREKNKQILDAIKEGGAEFGKPTSKFVEAAQAEYDAGLHSRVGMQLRTQDEITESRQKAHKYTLDVMRDALNGKDLGYDPQGYKAAIATAVQNAHPDVQKFIRDSSDEEVLNRLTDSAVKFHSGILPNTFVQIPMRDRFDQFLEDGKYKTTHDVESNHSGTDIRRAYESTLGILPSAPNDLRPASGYMGHKDWPQESSNPYEDLDMDAAGQVGTYGAIRLKLKPDVSERVAVGRGDSLNSLFMPVAHDEKDRDVIANAFTFPQGKESSMVAPTMLNFLEADRTGSFENVNNSRGYDEKADHAGRGYFEALIPGSFDLSEVEEVKMTQSDFALYATRKLDMKEEQRKILNVDKLRDLGFSEAEIQYLYSILDDDRGYKTLPSAIAIQKLIEFQAMKKEKDRIEKLGPSVVITHPLKKDMFDAASYKDGKSGDDIEKLLADRVYATVLDSTKRQIEMEKRIAENPMDEGEFG